MSVSEIVNHRTQTAKQRATPTHQQQRPGRLKSANAQKRTRQSNQFQFQSTTSIHCELTSGQCLCAVR